MKNCWQNQGDFGDKIDDNGIFASNNLLWFIFLIYINLTKFFILF